MGTNGLVREPLPSVALRDYRQGSGPTEADATPEYPSRLGWLRVVSALGESARARPDWEASAVLALTLVAGYGRFAVADFAGPYVLPSIEASRVASPAYLWG